MRSDAKQDEVSVGSYPRDDVFLKWAQDGQVREGTATIFVHTPGGTLEQAGQVELGGWDVLHPAVEVGEEFVIEIRARFGAQAYQRRVTFVATGDESGPAYVSAIGPGAHAEPGTGLFKKTRYSGFEFGVLVLAATTEQGTAVRGKMAPLIDHGAGDGVGA